jgi:signal transduction histidine kinase/tetratricopeptide (TPR) repeat protein
MTVSLRLVFVVVITSILFIRSFCQAPNTDSLEMIVNDLKGKEKVKVLSDLCYYLSYSDVVKSEKYGLQGLELAKDLNDSILIANAYNDLSILYTLKSNYRRGLEYNLKAYEIRKVLNDPVSMISSLSKIGVCYSELGEFENATNHLLKAINIVEQNQLESRYYMVYDNLGGVFKEMNKPENALVYHSKAYELAKNGKRIRDKYTILVNMANAYQNLGDEQKSIELHLKAEEMVTQTNDLRSQALIFSNLASLYSNLGKIDEVMYYNKKAKEAYEFLDNKDGLSMIHKNIASFYIGNQLLNEQNKEEVKQELDLSAQLAIECQSLPRQLQSYETYTQFYLVLNDYENAMVYKLKADSISDVLYTLENNKIVEELKTQYETEKKENELVQKEFEIKQKNYQLIIILGLLLFIVIGAIENYRKFRFKRKKLLEEARLKDELADIKIKNQIQEERLRISRDLHDNIGSQLTFIISSLDMAKYAAKKQKIEEVETKLGEIKDFSATTIDEFRDTIWALNKEQINLEDLELKITSFIQKAKSMVSGIQFSLDFSSNQDLEFDSEKGIRVFRIIQESVNNAVKHSKAKNIEIKCYDTEEGKIVLSTSDNGEGIDLENLERKNGLIHMETRAKKIGAEFKLETKLNEGTTISLYFNPLK